MQLFEKKKDLCFFNILGAALLLTIVFIVGCKEQTSLGERSVTTSNNPSASPMADNDGAYNDLVFSLGKKLDEIANGSQEQQKALEQTVKDYQSERKQIQGIFESVADRLDQIDKSINALENKYQELNNTVQGLSAEKKVKEN